MTGKITPTRKTSPNREKSIHVHASLEDMVRAFRPPPSVTIFYIFKQAAQDILKIYKVEEVVDVASAVNENKDGITGVENLFTTSIFLSWRRHIRILKRVPDLYGIFEIPEEVMSILSQDVKENSKLMVHIYLAENTV